MEPQKQLDLLQSQGKTVYPEIYKTYALYLRHLRESIHRSTQKAILELITSTKSELSQLPLESEQDIFQDKIRGILLETNSLITIEHLLDLSKTIENENDALIEKSRQSIKDKLKSDDTQTNVNLGYKDKSIELGLSLPLESELNLEPWYVPLNSSLSDDSYRNIDSDDTFDNIDKDNKDLSLRDEKADIFNSVLALAEKAISFKPFKKNIQSKEDSSDLEENNLNYSNEYNKNLITPESPQEILYWINSLENALQRRLRNTSHLINIELLRVGLIHTFIPTSLLDAVITNQIPTLDSPTNLLRIRLPINEIENIVDIFCLFITPSELEFDEFELRQSRNILNKYKKLLNNLVRKESYWKNRKLQDHLRNNWWSSKIKKNH